MKGGLIIWQIVVAMVLVHLDARLAVPVVAMADALVVQVVRVLARDLVPVHVIAAVAEVV